MQQLDTFVTSNSRLSLGHVVSIYRNNRTFSTVLCFWEIKWQKTTKPQLLKKRPRLLNSKKYLEARWQHNNCYIFRFETTNTSHEFLWSVSHQLSLLSSGNQATARCSKGQNLRISQKDFRVFREKGLHEKRMRFLRSDFFLDFEVESQTNNGSIWTK